MGKALLLPDLLVLFLLAVQMSGTPVTGQASTSPELIACRNRIEVNEPVTGQRLTLMFRTAVSGGPVDVRCSAGISSGEGQFRVVFNESSVRADIGTTSVEFIYDVVAVGGEQNVTCAAVSLPPGTQYIGEEANLVFYSLEARLHFFPASLRLAQPGASVLATLLFSFTPHSVENTTVTCGLLDGSMASALNTTRARLCSMLHQPATVPSNTSASPSTLQAAVPTPFSPPIPSVSSPPQTPSNASPADGPLLSPAVTLNGNISAATLSLPPGSRSLSFTLSPLDTEAVAAVGLQAQLLCCVPSCIQGNCSQGRFANASTVADIAVDIPASVNGTALSGQVSRLSGSSSSSSSPSSPSASCRCDLKVLVCDHSCCCDPDCNTEERLVMTSCDTASTSPAHSQSCDARGSAEWADWKNVLCVHANNNPDIGPTFTRTDRSNNTAQYRLLRSRAPSPVSSYGDITQPVNDITQGVVQGYRQGLPVLTAPSGTSPVGVLSLPDSNGPGCLDNAPVEFLVNRESNCQRHLTVTSCSMMSLFDLQRYLAIDVSPSRASSVTDQCWRGVGVLRSPSSTSTAVTAQCSVNVSCLASTRLDVMLQPQDPVLESMLSDLNQPTAVSSPNSSSSSSSSIDCAQPTPNLPAQPTLNTSSAICQNILLSLDYTIRWRGGEITAVAATVVLGQAAVDTTIQQRFSVKFEHIPAGHADVCSSPEATAALSGNPGYVAGRPLLSGQLVSSNAGTSTGVIATTSRLSTWSTARTQSSLCSQAGQDDVIFGHDRLSGCLLQLSLDDVSTRCESLKVQVLALQEQLTSATHVAATGSSLVTDTAEWIEILRSAVDVNGTSASSTDAMAGVSSPPPLATTTTPNATNSSTNTTRPFPLTGSCVGVPSQLTVTVLYASVGLNSDLQPRYQIVATGTNISATDWHFSCPDLSQCDNTSHLQLFELHSRVQFVEVPTTIPVVRSSDLTGHQQTQDCRYDTCAGDFFYPASDMFWRMLARHDQWFTLGTSLLALSCGLAAVLLNTTWHPPI